MAVKCFSCIVNFGGKMNNNMDYWKLNLLKFVGSLNHILDRLFDTIDEGIYFNFDFIEIKE